METLNCRATVGDVAGAAGLQVDEAEAALNALAADTLGTLQVSEEGDILYVLPPDFKARLRNRSLKLRLEPALQKARAAAAYLTRVSFGTALIASVTLVWVAILAIQSGSSRDDNRRGGGGGQYYGGSYGGARSGVDFNLSDILWYWDPWYYRRHQSRLQQGHRPGFLEAIFSFVFGDGDPNQGYEERRWKAVGQLIASKKGVVTAEELGPYSDVSAGNVRGEHNDGEVLDEGFVVPALIRFGGSADVDDNGNIIYRFPSFQKTAQRQAPAQPSPAAAQKAPWVFSNATRAQLFGAVALGVANLVGVVVLSFYAANPSIRYQLMNSSLGFVPGLLPALQAYAGAFFAIPFVRYLFNQQKNTVINAQNEFRHTAEQKILGDRDMIYRSDRSKDSGRGDLDDFDSRLGKGRGSSRIVSDEKYKITP
ncbi:hypothetical protein WJX84_006746 [Apatococcus fuscideae]|uniref:Iron-sulfur cluster biosynthesis family protein n=1 Tax=Apatococcus fuscideae TaxID=2026836 RepID=A0AAW1SRU4_9CHLO